MRFVDSSRPKMGEILRKWYVLNMKKYKLFLHIKGIFQPFELRAETSLIRLAVKFFKAGHFQKNFLMIQSHERSLKPISAA